jgi:hypothetical protein
MIKSIILSLAAGEDSKFVLKRYQQLREDVLRNVDDKDFDHIDMSEFRNWLAAAGYEWNGLLPAEKRELMLKFYQGKVQESMNGG